MNVFRAKKTREAEPVGDVQDSLTLDLRAPTPPLEIASHGISGGDGFVWDLGDYEEPSADEGMIIDPYLSPKRLGLQALSWSSLLPERARVALDGTPFEKRLRSDLPTFTHWLDKHSLANFTDEALYFEAGVQMTEQKIDQMRKECLCDSCAKCQRRMDVETGRVRLSYRDVVGLDGMQKKTLSRPTSSEGDNAEKPPSPFTPTDWKNFSSSLLTTAPGLDRLRATHMGNKTWTEHRLQDAAPRLEPYLCPGLLITDAAVELEARLRDETEASRRRTEFEQRRR